MPVQALEIRVDGVDSDLRKNVEAIPSLLALQLGDQLSPLRLQRVKDEILAEAADALKPFGYYQPEITIDLMAPGSQQSDSSDEWQVRINISPGKPVTVSQLDVQLHGPGRQQPQLLEWQSDWPLTNGEILDQVIYEEKKNLLPRLARRLGYVDAQYTNSEIRLDATTGEADISLHFQTGERAVFGQITYSGTEIDASTLARMPAFKTGDNYKTADVDALRSALAGSNYFSTVDISENIVRDTSPPVIDLQVDVTPSLPNTYTVGTGFGTDTGPRLQAGWARNRLNRRGDSLSVGFGVQATDQEFFLRSDYMRPRGNNPGDFYFASLNLQRLDDDFEFEDTDSGEDVFPELDGERLSQLATVGIINQTRLTDRFLGGLLTGWLLERRYFLSFLNEDFETTTNLGPVQTAVLADNGGLDPLISLQQQALTAGTSFDLLNVSGTGFDIHGTRAHLRILGSLEGAGSDLSFLQAYFGINQQWRFGTRSKLLLSGELGYTEADVTNLDLMLGDTDLNFSLTELPERYRFQAGGDRSVRGFGFESLSNNRNGSNHLLTASAEYEYLVGDNWSLAAFVDTGNAFNDFKDPDLNTAIGIGARFYTIVGPIRLDFATALNETGSDFRIHITIGSPLFTFGSRPFLGGPN